MENLFIPCSSSFPPGFSPIVDKWSLEDVVEGKWSLREENGKVYVDVEGTVDVSRRDLSYLPWNFGIVTGDFLCSHNSLKSLEGAPQEVGKGVLCIFNFLKDLRGAPRKVGENFYCFYNPLKSLEGIPEEVGGGIYTYFGDIVNFTLEDIRRAQEESWIRNHMSSLNNTRFSLEKLSSLS